MFYLSFVQDCTYILHQSHWSYVATPMWIEHVELQQEHYQKKIIAKAHQKTLDYQELNWTYLFCFKFRVNPKYELRIFDIPKPISGSWKMKFGFCDKLNALLKLVCNNNTATVANPNINVYKIIFDCIYVVKLNFWLSDDLKWCFFSEQNLSHHFK